MGEEEEKLVFPQFDYGLSEPARPKNRYFPSIFCSRWLHDGGQMSGERMAMFPHRQNEDGTFDSICPDCFSTVVRGLHTESQLTEFEDRHACHSDLSAAAGGSFENIVLMSRRVFELLKE
jgi:hypothetical protein